MINDDPVTPTWPTDPNQRRGRRPMGGGGWGNRPHGGPGTWARKPNDRSGMASAMGQQPDEGVRQTMIPETPDSDVTPPAAPDTSATPSASDANGVLPTSSGSGTDPLMGTPGAMAHPGAANFPGSIYFADGGDVPAGGGDVVKQALAYGRQKFRLPAQFFGDTGGEGASPAPRAYAEGGVIPTEEDQGDTGGGQVDPHTTMAYLMGHGAMPPEQAAALEQQTGGNKMAALQAAGSPDRAFSLMQHYRQKFNGLSAFAKAALQGAGGRPPNPAAAAQALNMAYAEVPGDQIRFTPTQGGMHVSVGGQDDQSQDEPQQFAEGGGVDDMTYETAGAQPWAASSTDISDQAEAAKEGQNFYGGKAPHERLRDLVMSIPQLLGWVSKPEGQFDGIVENGAQWALSKADKGTNAAVPQGMEPGSPGSQQQSPDLPPPAPPPMPRRGPNSPPWTNPGNPFQPPRPEQAQAQQQRPQVTPAEAQKMQQVAAQASEAPTLQEVIKYINRAFPSPFDDGKRAWAVAQALQHHRDNLAKIEQEKTRGDTAVERAKQAADAKIGVANINVAGRQGVEETRQAGADKRNIRTTDAKRDIATERETGVQGRFVQGEQGRDRRAIVAAKPGVLGSEEKFQSASKSIGSQQTPPAAQRPAPQKQAPSGVEPPLKLVNGKWYKRGPDGKAIEVQPPAK